MLDAKKIMLHIMAKSGQWEDAHATSIASFFYNLETHQRKDQKNGKKTLLLYQSHVCREWFDALKRGEGFNIELIEDDLLRCKGYTLRTLGTTTTTTPAIRT